MLSAKHCQVSLCPVHTPPVGACVAYFVLLIFAHESRRAAVLLKTVFPGLESLSAQK